MNANGLIAENSPLSLDWGDQFLEWISNQGIAMFERKLKLGAIKYFHFSSRFTVVDERSVSSFGSHPDRKTAALKCAAEAIERQTMVRFFKSHEHKFPKCIRNSNGWAVHQTAEAAVEKARSESIERHLLLHSFFKFGWSGFIEVHAVEAPTMTVRFYTTRAVRNGIGAGLVVAQSSVNHGVSFGYCLLSEDEQKSGEAWQSAMFEAVDKLIILAGQSPSEESVSWITRETHRFLREPFDLSLFCASPDSAIIESDVGHAEVEIIDLGAEYNSEFSLFAAFVHGGNLIPLFSKAELDCCSESRIRSVLAVHGISQIPDRHPIL